MWFKNLYVYQLQGKFPLSAEELEERLSNKPLVECGNDQRESVGWVTALGNGTEAMVHAVDGCMLLTLAHQERILPASVIKDELEERVAEIQERESRKVGGKEKKDLREQIEFELLPRAFVRTRKLDAWIDPANQWLIINTASPTQAERFTGMLRKAVDSLPVAMPETNIEPGTLLTHWLGDSLAMPEAFELGEGCELVGMGDDRSKVTFKAHEMQAEEVHTHLDGCKVVSKLQLIWGNKISFTLTEDFQVKGLKFLDVLDEQLDKHDPESFAEKMDIEFALMSGEVRELLGDLMAALNPDVSQEEATAATFGVAA